MGDNILRSTESGAKDFVKVRCLNRDRCHFTVKFTRSDSCSFILENQEAISTAACLDSGKTRVDSCFGEILVTVEKLKWTILHGERALKAERRPTTFLMAYKVNEVRWEPLGVVAACVSWKYASPPPPGFRI